MIGQLSKIEDNLIDISLETTTLNGSSVSGHKEYINSHPHK